MDLKIWKKGKAIKKEEENMFAVKSLFSGEVDNTSASEYSSTKSRPPEAVTAPSLFKEETVRTASDSVYTRAEAFMPPAEEQNAPALFAGSSSGETAPPASDSVYARAEAFMPPAEEQNTPALFAGNDAGKAGAAPDSAFAGVDSIKPPEAEENAPTLFSGNSTGNAAGSASDSVYAKAESIRPPAAGQTAPALFIAGSDAEEARPKAESVFAGAESIKPPAAEESVSETPAENKVKEAVQPAADSVYSDAASIKPPAAKPGAPALFAGNGTEQAVQPASEAVRPEEKPTAKPAVSYDHSFFMPPEDKPEVEKETITPVKEETAEVKNGFMPPQAEPVKETVSFKPPQEEPVKESVQVNTVFKPPQEEPVKEAVSFKPVFQTPDLSSINERNDVQESPDRQDERLSPEEVRIANEQIRKVIDNVETAIIGKRTVVELVLMTMLARGHVLLEDVPGVGKTSLVSCIARSVDCDFKRIQFTPDLMPSDITSFSIYNQKSGEFEFRPGSAMSNIVLADEINRASAKTQSAMLEIMEEKQVTVDSQTFEMQEPFFVIASQKPAEIFGTHPLPEAQIDRFMVKLAIGYPKVEEEQRIIHSGREAKKKLSAVITRQDILHLRDQADRVWVDPLVERYIVEIVAATRANAKIVMGSSPRGSIALNNAAKVYALFQNRGYVIPDDVKYLAPHILAHRLILSHEAKNEQTDPKDLINEIVSSIIAPR